MRKFFFIPSCIWKPYILEIATVVAVLLCIVGVIVPMAARAHEHEHRIQCLENLQRIGVAIRQWSLENDYALPPGRGKSGFCNSSGNTPKKGNLHSVEPGLNSLWNKGNGVIKDITVLRCPGDKNLLPPPQPGEDITHPNQISYGMTGRIYPTDLPNKVIVADKSDKSLPDGATRNSANHNHRFTNVLFFDGSVRTCDTPRLPSGVGSETGSIYLKETGLTNDTYIE